MSKWDTEQTEALRVLVEEADGPLTEAEFQQWADQFDGKSMASIRGKVSYMVRMGEAKTKAPMQSQKALLTTLADMLDYEGEERAEFLKHGANVKKAFLTMVIKQVRRLQSQ